MLDLKLIREDPEIVRQDLKKRKDEEKLKWVDELLELDEEWRKVKQETDGLRAERNKVSLEISEARKEKKDASALQKKAAKVVKDLEVNEVKEKDMHDKILFYLKRMPNITHSSVPYGKDSSENKVVRNWGTIRKPQFPLKSHVELAEHLGIADFDRSNKISGSGFYFLKGPLVLLNQALLRFALEYLVNKGFIPVEPPLMMRREPYEGVTDLNDFADVMYKIDSEDSYLIATSEHPIASMHMNEVLEDKDLPLKYAGVSMCFRKEVGSHGIDTKGLFRTHQFTKVEQFVFSRKEDSWKIHEDLIKNAEELFKKLELPYRIVNICTGDLGIVAAKKYDLEVWMPRQQEYKEACSVSNCTDYQARRLNVKVGKHGGEKEFVHTLNATAIAMSRAMVAILENYQNKDGSITVPKALVPYMHGMTEIRKA